MKEERVYPLVCDYNPGLPNVSRVLAKHRHILSLDDELMRVIVPDSIFASHRRAKTIQDMLVNSKLPRLLVAEAPDVAEAEVMLGGCQPCKKTCVLCKHYLKSTKYAYSFHTSSTYPIKEILDCNNQNIVYIINDKICRRSYTGCSSDSAKVRFANHKSHIKHGRKTCEVSTHFCTNQQLHTLDKTSFASYDKSLKCQLEIIIIERVNIIGTNLDAYSRLNQCKVRERYWQHKLRTMQEYGGLNVREEGTDTIQP